MSALSLNWDAIIQMKKIELELITDMLKKSWIMSKSLFEHTKFKLRCNYSNEKNWAWTYYRYWHPYIIWKSIRGGISFISMRYSKASNKYLKFYDPKQGSKHVIYLDPNIYIYIYIYIYGYAMSKFYSASGFNCTML